MSQQPRSPLGSSGTSPEPSERELTVIMKDLWEHSERLLQQEMQLALSELDARLDKGKVALRHATIGTGLMHGAYLSILATLVLVLSEFLVPWLAALVVTSVASAGAYAFMQLGKKAADESTEPSPSTDRFRSGAIAPRH